MKILYAIQGTGNGHISRASAILPLLRKKAKVDILISGTQADVLPDGEITYRLHGLSFIFGTKGGVDILETYRSNKLKTFWKEVKSLPVENYDLVINDFEPVSAWACQLKSVPCLGLSHQAAVLHRHAPKPAHKDLLGQAILRHYAPVHTSYGFHFEQYHRHIFPPVIRSEIRAIAPVNGGHYTVYLPAFSDAKLLKMLSLFTNTSWQVFSKHSSTTRQVKNVNLQPISNAAFVLSLATCEGLLCGAGFESPSEALFLGKKLMVLPMKGQYEQQCNAASLKKMGVPVLRSLKAKHAPVIAQWLREGKPLHIPYPDLTADILDVVLTTPLPVPPNDYGTLSTPRKFKDYLLRSIFKSISKATAAL